MSKSCVVVVMLLLCHSTFPIVIFTRKKTEPAIKVPVDFSLTTNAIDSVREIIDDFTLNSTIKPYSLPTQNKELAQQIGQTASQPKLNTTTIKDDDGGFAQITMQESQEPEQPSINEQKEYLNNEEAELFESAVHSPTNLEEMPDTFNLFSRGSFQPSYLASDFNLYTDMYLLNPQFTSVVDYYINNHFLTPGERYITSDSTFNVMIVRKNQQGFSGNLSITPYEYTVTCPDEARVEFDVSEFDSIPTYLTNTRTKGCIISLNSAPGWYT